MAVDARIRELGTRHQNLDKAIHDELSRPASNDAKLKDLKRKKLKLKEQIEALRATAH